MDASVLKVLLCLFLQTTFLLVAGDKGKHLTVSDLITPVALSKSDMVKQDGPDRTPQFHSSLKLDEAPSVKSVIENAPNPSSELHTFVDDILERTKRSDATTCNHNIVDSLSQAAREACNATIDIDKYIYQVKSVSPVRISSFYEERLKDVVNNYNVDLKSAQRKYNEWRMQGGSIFSELKDTFTAAKEFEPQFNAEFEKSQMRIDAIVNRNVREIMNMEADIRMIQTDIADIQAVINLTSSSKALAFMTNSLTQKRLALEELLNNKERADTELELMELISFLEFVNESVGAIRSKAVATESRVEVFRENITRDSGIFLRHRAQAQVQLERLQAQRISYINERSRLQNEKQELEANIVKVSDKIRNLSNQYVRSKEELAKILSTIQHKQREAKDKQIAGGVLMIIPIFGWIAGATLLGLSIDEESRLANHKRNLIRNYEQMLEVEKTQVNSLHSEIEYAIRRIRANDAKLNRINSELSNFGSLNRDLDKILKDIGSILPAVNKALSSTDKLKKVFNGLVIDLNRMIEAAKDGKMSGLSKNLSEFIYNGISTLKCKWEQASVRIVTLGECK
ncbi:hypothetical protein SK128_025297 [Halocaridina rubra]|uniref:Uncharacterized protein n=1 Tax=Halocaridina rubra TaxID=373956 RepID=A0AAN8XIK9_HALRR